VTLKINLERRSKVWLAINGDGSATLIDNTENGGQAESGSPAGSLGTEERLEYMRLGFGVHS